MIDYIWHSTFALIGLAGVIVIVCGVVAWFVPPLRRIAIEVGGVVLGATALYAKGARDQAKAQQAKTEKAVRNRQADDAKIDSRPDTPDDVDKRLRNGSF